MGRHNGQYSGYTRAQELKTIVEALDTARVTNYETIVIPGFSVLQLEKALRSLRHLAANAWYHEANKDEAQTIL